MKSSFEPFTNPFNLHGSASALDLLLSYQEQHICYFLNGKLRWSLTSNVNTNKNLNATSAFDRVAEILQSQQQKH